jgi:hypothetical protein
VEHVRVRLDGHQLVDGDRAVLAHAPEVVAAEIDEHDVLGTFLRILEQLLCAAPVLLIGAAARIRAGDWSRLDATLGDLDQRLRGGPRDLEVAEVEEVHVGGGVDHAQAAVDRERLDRRRRREALRGHDLERVSRVDVLDDPSHHGLELLAGDVGRELGIGPLAGRGDDRICRPHTTGHRLRKPLPDLADRV